MFEIEQRCTLPEEKKKEEDLLEGPERSELKSYIWKRYFTIIQSPFLKLIDRS